MKRLRNNRLANDGKRPKAFIGAIIGAVTSVAGSVIGGINKRKQQRKQEAEEAARLQLEKDKAATQSYVGNEDMQDEYERRFQQEFKSGGKFDIAPSKKGTFTAAATKHGQSVQGFASKVLANKDNYSSAMVKKAIYAHNAPKWKHAMGGVEPVITEGGKAIRLNGRTSLLRGRKHKTGGIVIGRGKNSIEAESGEVIENTGNEMKIFSAQPILNGKSPAQLVVNGADTNKVFNAQEQYKDMNGINDDGTKKSKRKLKNGGRRDLNTKIGQQQFEQFQTGMRQARTSLTEPMRSNVGSNTSDIPSFSIQDNLELPRKDIAGISPVEGKQNVTSRRLASKKSKLAPQSVSTISQKPSVERTMPNNTVVQPNTKVSETSLNKPIEVKSSNTTVNYNVTDDFSKLPNGGVATTIGGKNYYFPNEEERDKFINKVNLAISNKRNPKQVNNISGKYRDYDRENGRFIRRGRSNRLQTTNRFAEIPQFKCGGKAKKKAAYGMSLTKDNWISSAISAAGNVASGLTNLAFTNKMKAPENPQLASANKLQTNYNINPQLGAIERSRQSLIRGVDRDTQSSVAALSRRNRILAGTAEQENQLYGQKENIETQLLNQDALNQQQVSNANVDRLTEGSLRRQEFYNQKAANQANAVNTIIGGVSGAATDLIAQGQQRYNENQQISAIIGSNEKNNLKYMIDAGYKPNKSQIEAALSSSTTQAEKDYYTKVLDNLYGNKRTLKRRGLMSDSSNLLAN